MAPSKNFVIHPHPRPRCRRRRRRRCRCRRHHRRWRRRASWACFRQRLSSPPTGVGFTGAGPPG